MSASEQPIVYILIALKPHKLLESLSIVLCVCYFIFWSIYISLQKCVQNIKPILDFSNIYRVFLEANPCSSPRLHHLDM